MGNQIESKGDKDNEPVKDQLMGAIEADFVGAREFCERPEVKDILMFVEFPDQKAGIKAAFEELDDGQCKELLDLLKAGKK